MADTHHDDSHGAAILKAYMVVAVALSICTASSFFFNSMARAGHITHFVSFVLILGVAILKATMVGMYFMHLKWDWRLLYFLIVPAFILGAMMMTVFLPDIFFGPYHDASEQILIAKQYQKVLK